MYGAGTKHTLTVIVRASPYLMYDVLGEWMIYQLDKIVVINHV